MQHTYLGRTGVKVSRLCLGCMSYGDPRWRPWVLDEQAAMPFFRKAVEAGINFFDTADVYSLGVSEEITGKALREYAKMEQVVTGHQGFPAWARGRTWRASRGSTSSRAARLACGGWAWRPSTSTRSTVSIRTRRWRRRYPPWTCWSVQGKVRYLGASSMAAWKFAKALSLSERNGWARFVTMQNHYNLIYREEEREMIPLCQAEGIGVIPWSPLARGLLAGTRKTPDDKTPTARAASDDFAWKLYDHPADIEVMRACQAVAKRLGVQPAQVAIAWLLSKPAMTAPIIGATKIEHLETALATRSI
jgi:aryl-alcohol dehydrogenase-like predicted oxidoreductase